MRVSSTNLPITSGAKAQALRATNARVRGISAERATFSGRGGAFERNDRPTRVGPLGFTAARIVQLYRNNDGGAAPASLLAGIDLHA